MCVALEDLDMLFHSSGNSSRSAKSRLYRH
jgi:hypothetical protein